MRVLIVHNYYRERGGEDQVFEDEKQVLAGAGHEVATLSVSNDSIRPGVVGATTTAVRTVWSSEGAALVREAAERHASDIVHFHNTFPLISPAAYRAAHAAGAAVVQTLHNYRLACPKAVLFRDGAICEDCLGRRLAWPSVRHACYRKSHTGSATVAAMLAVHRTVGTWTTQVDRYVALTEFQRSKMVATGLPADRVDVCPNALITDPGTGRHDGGFLFVGRLSEEKGVATLVDAWRDRRLSQPLRIVGDGPARPGLEAAAAGIDSIDFVGALDHGAVIEEMKRARALLFPSVWYEGCPMTILEAFAVGLPVIASRIGGLPELVEEGRSGWLFAPGDAGDLASVVDELEAAGDELRRRQLLAREAYEERFTAPRLAERLTSIFEAARKVHRSASSA